MKEVKLEIKTVEHNGQVLQIGQRYEFSDDGVRWVWDRLEGMNKSKGRPYDAEKSHFKHIRVIKTDDNGTITPAPVKLTHDQAYIFDYKDSALTGLYNKIGQHFLINTGWVNLAYATNIRRLVEEKTLNTPLKESK
jgi:hypothetical protein